MKHVTIYTDGACSGNPGPGGYAAILMCGSAKREISGGEAETTNNRMELRAPVEALRLLSEKCDVEIYSDSSYVVDSFNKGWIYSWKKNGWARKDGPLKNAELIKELYELCSYHNVKWIKVRGHSDNEYNNRCDALAVAASRSAAQDITPCITPSVTHDDAVRRREYTGELYERKTAVTTAFKGRIFDVEVADVTLPDGSVSKREIVRHPGGAAIAAIDGDKNILLVEQYRIAADRIMLEIPAGKLEEGEDPELCAARELEEETGFRPSYLKHVSTFYPTPGYCTEKLHIYFTDKIAEGNINRDEGEFLHIVRIPFEKAHEMVLSGEINDAKTAVAVLAARAYV